MAPRRTVLITGCSTGIGRAAALAFHREGFAVHATARSPEALKDLADEGVHTSALDVLDEESMRATVEDVQSEYGAVDVLVNNAGYALQSPVEEADMADVRAQFETNVFGLVRLTQLVLPAMRAQKSGRIINLSSMGGRFTLPGGGFYHASKHAVEAISDALRLEVASFGVDVCIVEPGPVLTEFGNTAVRGIAAGTAESDRPDGPYDDFKRRLAATYAGAYDGRRSNLASSPETVAKTIVKAASATRPKARYVVGPMAYALVNTRRALPDRAFDALLKTQFPTP